MTVLTRACRWESLQLNGQKAIYNHQNDSIYVTSDGSQSKEQSLKLSFKGIPKDGLIIGKNKYGSRTFFGDNWPNRAQNWFACNDHLSDKATVEFIVHAPKHYKVVANGQLMSIKKSKANKTYHYSSSISLPTKVMVIGVADMHMEEAGIINGKKVNSCVYPKHKKRHYMTLHLPLPFWNSTPIILPNTNTKNWTMSNLPRDLGVWKTQVTFL